MAQVMCQRGTGGVRFREAQQAATCASFDATVLARQIAATDAQIDRLVYALYELTDDEIRIVERATG
jgi:hypothetical protein